MIITFQLFKDYGRHLSSLAAKLKCLFSLQDAAIRKGNLDTNLVFITPVNLSNIATYIEEIVSEIKPFLQASLMLLYFLPQT